VLQPRTILEGVTMLEPGTLQVEEEGQPSRVHRYWLMPPPSHEHESRGEAVARVRVALEESVLLASKADAPVGAFLSGGIDSSAIVALMAASSRSLRTYTLRVGDPKADESAAARDFATRLQTVHTEVEVPRRQVAGAYLAFSQSLDQPSTDGFNTWLVSRAAARDVRAVLSGLGADEWFGGYPVARRMAQLQSSPGRRMLGAAAEVTRKLLPDGAIADQATRLASRASGLATWAASHRVFLPGQIGKMTGTAPGDGATRLGAAFAHRIRDAQPQDLACQLDVWSYMCCQLLRDSDVASMAHSIELRLPYVDPKFAAVARSIAPESSLGSGKQVLSDALVGLVPESIRLRPKQGFSLPYDDWLLGPLAELSGDAISDLRGRGWLEGDLTLFQHFPQRWALMALQLWAQSVLDSAPSAIN
jgi:asparagine synthase (glutamine-hydrolysing)